MFDDSKYNKKSAANSGHKWRYQPWLRSIQCGPEFAIAYCDCCGAKAKYWPLTNEFWTTEKNIQCSNQPTDADRIAAAVAVLQFDPPEGDGWFELAQKLNGKRIKALAILEGRDQG